MSPKRAARAGTARAGAGTARTAARGAATLSAKDRRNFAKYHDDKLALRARVAKGAGPAMKKLMALSIEDEQNMTTSLDGYKALSTLRRAAYREHARSMKIDPEIAAVIGDLANRYGPKVKVWHNLVDWTVAILISRYGEAPEHWPKEFTADDLKRAREMHDRKRALKGTHTFDGLEPTAENLRQLHRETPGPNGEPAMLVLGIDEPSFDEE